MAKPATVKIKLVSTADTGFFYVTKKNPRNQTEKMSFRKYDPVARPNDDPRRFCQAAAGQRAASRSRTKRRVIRRFILSTSSFSSTEAT